VKRTALSVGIGSLILLTGCGKEVDVTEHIMTELSETKAAHAEESQGVRSELLNGAQMPFGVNPGVSSYGNSGEDFESWYYYQDSSENRTEILKAADKAMESSWIPCTMPGTDRTWVSSKNDQAVSLKFEPAPEGQSPTVRVTRVHHGYAMCV
jgi:hypothetical protein